MSRLKALVVAGVVGGAFLGWAGSASAIVITETLTFSGSDAGGTGSSTMTVEIDTDADTITMTLDNTSPIFLDGSTTDPNAPGITGFGANFAPDSFDLGSFTSWELTAFDVNGNPVTIGTDAGAPDNWILLTGDTNNQGIQLDLNPDNGVTGPGQGIQDALYNPLADPTAFGADPNFLTTAVFTINYATDAIPDTLQLATEDSGSGLTTSTVVRMQNVGANGDGSLKLPGTPGNGTDVPEPATLAMLGSGLAGIGWAIRRRRKQVA
jgi:hypothetical protein